MAGKQSDSLIIKGRIAAIRRLLNKRKIDCLLIVKPANVGYMTGFSGDDSWAVISPEKVYLITDSRYTEQAQGECLNCEIIERKKPITQATAEIINGLKNVKIIGVESSCSIVIFNTLKRKIKKRIRPAADVIEQLRLIKDNCEISSIKNAADIAAKALKNILREIKAGISENELAGKLDLQIRLLGGKTSFDTIVAFGSNASHPHHQPGGAHAGFMASWSPKRGPSREPSSPGGKSPCARNPSDRSGALFHRGRVPSSFTSIAPPAVCCSMSVVCFMIEMADALYSLR